MFQVLVVFQTGDLEQFLLLLLERKCNGSRPRIHQWIGDGSLIVDRVSINWSKPFHNRFRIADDFSHFIQPAFPIEIRCLHHERVAFPMAYGIAMP